VLLPISVTPSISISNTPSISVTPSATPSISISRTPSISVTPSTTPSISISSTPSISVTPSITPSVTPAPCLLYDLSVNSGASADFSYVDCNGNAASILVPLGDNPTICAQSGPTPPAVIIGDGNIVNTYVFCSVNPSLSPSVTPSTTPSITPSSSPSPPTCTEHSIYVDSAERNSADGNVIYYNYQDCDGIAQTQSFAASGTQCSLILGTQYLFYYISGNPIQCVDSNITNTGVPC